MEQPAEVEDLCDFCGGPTSAAGWLVLEVQRPDPRPEAGEDEADYINVGFCSQEHAAAWLARPLPDPVTPEPVEQTWRERASDALVIGGLVATPVLAVVGVVALVIWGWGLLWG